MIDSKLLELQTGEVWPLMNVRWWLGRQFRGMIAHAAVELDWLAQAKRGQPYARATRSEIKQLAHILSRPNGEKDERITADFWIANQIAEAYSEAYKVPAPKTNPEYTAARLRVAEGLRKASQGGEGLSETETKQLMMFCVALHRQMERWAYAVYQPIYRRVG